MKKDVSSLFSKITYQEYLNREIKNKLENYGYKLISTRGVDRLVFRKNEYVIKVARNRDKVDMNYDESAFWNQNKNKKLFCPVTDNCPHYTWIEMPYCNESPGEFRKYENKIKESIWNIPDLHPDNIGRLKGTSELVCFDYPDAMKIEIKE